MMKRVLQFQVAKSNQIICKPVLSVIIIMVMVVYSVRHWVCKPIIVGSNSTDSILFQWLPQRSCSLTLVSYSACWFTDFEHVIVHNKKVNNRWNNQLRWSSCFRLFWCQAWPLIRWCSLMIRLSFVMTLRGTGVESITSLPTSLQSQTSARNSSSVHPFLSTTVPLVSWTYFNMNSAFFLRC